jgi:hypothetical protein
MAYFFLPGMIIFCLILSGCGNGDSGKAGKSKSLFEYLPPRSTGIHFENRLHDDDTFNILFYEYYYNGAGLAACDVNNDGFSDIFLGGNMEKSRLYINKGGLKFEDITEESGINTSGRWITGVSMADLNHDGLPDLYLSVGGNILDNYHNLLYMNQSTGGKVLFTECAKAVGLDDNGYSIQAAFFDYDLDEDLDMYLVTSSMRVPNKNAVRSRTSDGSMINTDRLYRNEGIDPATSLPKFSNVSKEAGIVWDGFGLGICISDINLDGWPDVYVANDYISNDLLYINQRDGTFRDMAGEYFKHFSYSAMGMDIADINNDGLTDVFTLDMLPEDYYRKRIMAGNMREYGRYEAELATGYSPQYIRNMLQLNNGNIDGKYSFSEIGQLAGVFETDWSWAPLFADFDNDGYKDLFIGNGIPHDLTNMDFAMLWQSKIRESPDMPFNLLGSILMRGLDKKGNVKKSNFIFKNNGDLTFKNMAGEWGMDRPLYSTGAIFSDLDNDGDLDLVLNNLNETAAIYKNKLIDNGGYGSDSHFLAIHLTGSEQNREGIGTKITIYHGGDLQYYEHFPVRGFQSMVDPNIHFGLGKTASVDSLHVIWPDGRSQVLYNIPVNRQLVLLYSNSGPEDLKGMEGQNAGIFKEITTSSKLNYIHKEKEFLDFDIQPLIPHLYSKEGPGIAAGDINGDGLDDFYIGGATGSAGRVFIQQETGIFYSYDLPCNNNYEDMGAILFDADGDGDNDLYVVSGGTGLPPGNQFYTDRIYANDGNGNFALVKDALPDEKVCGSQVSAADFDRDGDLDLFVCGRVSLENYPLPARSFLLRNESSGQEKIRFTDVTHPGEGLNEVGLISAALWTDYNRDGWPDLMLAGEWMSPKLFKNNNGEFVDVTAASGLADYTGWWNSLSAADFDLDGDMDYVAGNLGLNTRFKVSPEEPMIIYAGDFDKNGQYDPVCSYFVQGKSYPIYQRNVLISQIPYLQNKFPKYEDYAKASMKDIFDAEQIRNAYTKECRYFNSALFENKGDGTFTVRALPVEAQFAPVFGMLAYDFNNDGNPDILIAGNSSSFNVDDGQMDAGTGLYLQGDGEGGFQSLPSRISGFFADGDVRGMAELALKNGNSLIIVAQNSSRLKAFENATTGAKLLRLNKNDAYGEIRYEDGRIERKEFYYGSGYLSHTSRVCRITSRAVSVKIIEYSGTSREIFVK